MSVYNYNGLLLDEVFEHLGGNLNYAYNSSGEQIYSKGSSPEPPIPVYSVGLNLLHSSYPGINSPQGMATFGNYIFQFFSNVNEFHIYRLDDFTEVSSFSCTAIDHGNSLQFGKEMQSNGFPLLYCSAYMCIYVLNIDLNGFSLVDTITLPSSTSNASTNSVIDFDSERIYVVGYTASSIYTRGNYIISELDLNDTSDVIASWQHPYLGVTQGVVWDGEHIVVNCNTYDGQYVQFHFINPSTHNLDKTEQFVKEYQSPLDSEYQGFSYEKDYYLVSKWVYKDHPNTRSLYYEFYSYVPDWSNEQS